MRVLVTGGAGFIGCNLVRFLLREYEELQLNVLDKLTYAGNLCNLGEALDDNRLCFLEGDVIVMDPIRVDPPADPIILKHQWTFRVLRLEGDSMSIQAQSPMGDTIIRMHRVRENKSE